MKIRTYSELSSLKTFAERFEYLKLDGSVGIETFRRDRYFNQKFYGSKEWRRIRNSIILRDNGCDMGLPGFDIYGKVLIHHINPITVSDIADYTEYLTNPEFLICVSFDTHNAIHYGSADILQKAPPERRPNDTCPWRR